MPRIWYLDDKRVMPEEAEGEALGKKLEVFSDSNSIPPSIECASFGSSIQLKKTGKLNKLLKKLKKLGEI